MTELNNKLVDLMIHMVNITDDVLREQLQEEYEILENAIKHQEYQELKNKELLYYQSLFQCSTLSKSIEMNNNIDINELCIKHHLRPLTTIDSYTLIAFLQAQNATLIIYDMANNIINQIGKGTLAYYIYVYCLERYEVNLQPCYKL
jgi:hypothetical protein